MTEVNNNPLFREAGVSAEIQFPQLRKGAEQVIRLAAFRRGPAASVLRFFVRPFVRKLL